MECNLIDRDVDMLFYAEQQIETLMEALSDGITEENIDTGTSGMLLLILDMYQRTQKPSYLAFANDAILRLVEWCRSHPTNNYALYTGRGGVAYLLIRRYMLDGDRSYLHLASELLKPANERFLHSRYTTDYLYDGRAGTLLVLAYLYRMTGEGWLKDYVGMYAAKILINARISDEGTYWEAQDELNCRPSCSFAYGIAGIQYVLRYVDGKMENDAVQYILQQSDKYLDGCWNELEGNWCDGRREILDTMDLQRFRDAYQEERQGLYDLADDTSWAYGAGGIAMAIAATGRRTAGGMTEKLSGALMENDRPAGGLHHGIAGLALCLMQPFSSHGQSESIISSIVRRLTNEQGGALKGGLMHGNAGWLYCLLQYLQPSENILCPLAPDPNSPPGDHIPLSVQLSEVLALRLVQFFPRTVYMIQKVSPRWMKEFVEDGMRHAGGSELSRFIAFMESKWSSGPTSPLNERMSDLFGLERKKLLYYRNMKKSSFHLFLKRLSHNDTCLHLLSRPEQWLFQQPITISPAIEIVATKWNWSLNVESESADRESMLKRYIYNLNAAPKKYEYVFCLAGKFDDVECYFESAYRTLLRIFEKPCTLAAAIAWIRQHIEHLPAMERDVLLVEIGVREDSKGKAFFGTGTSLVAQKLKAWIHRDILSFDRTLSVKD